jgi:SHS2 domain-containing protein
MARQSQYFHHDADIGVIGKGKTVEGALESAAQSMFDIMVDTAKVRPDQEISVEFEEEDPEYALVTWLNELLAVSRANGLVLGKFALEREGSWWRGQAWGEPWADHHERGVEVKGATLTMLAVRQDRDGWEACCVVDV